MVAVEAVAATVAAAAAAAAAAAISKHTPSLLYASILISRQLLGGSRQRQHWIPVEAAS